MSLDEQITGSGHGAFADPSSAWEEIAGRADEVAGQVGAVIRSRQVFAVFVALLEHAEALERRIARLEKTLDDHGIYHDGGTR